jgi:hypothetical protein
MDRLSQYRISLTAMLKPLSWNCDKALAIIFLTALIVGPSCSREINKPRDVAEQFLEAITKGNKGAIDTLVAWDKVLLAEGYIPWNIFNLYTAEKKNRETARYKERFFERDMPLLRLSNYTIKQVRGVVVNRDDSDVFIIVSFTGKEGSKIKGRELETTLELKLIPSLRKWVITDLGDLIHLNMVEGQFDPDSLYLRKQIP